MAFRTKKISQMDPKGSNLASTDLLEISELVSGSYVTKSITGAEIIASVPPTTVNWGAIGGTLSAQTDLQNALDAKVPTSRTLTINGTTQDLSADRTFTVSTGITIGATVITSGTVGRVLFDGTGNVVQESANLFWDNVNGRLGINKPIPLFSLDVLGATRVGPNTPTEANAGFIASSGNHFFYIKSISSTSGEIGFRRGTSSGSEDGDYKFLFDNASAFINYNRLSQILSTSCQFHLSYVTAGSERGRWTNTGNFLINTTTDAGFKLDVNGTLRSQGKLTVSAGGFDLTGTLTNFSGYQGYGQMQLFSGNAFQMFNSANNSKISLQYTTATGLSLSINPENLSGVLNGLAIGPSLVASANNQTLVAFDVAPAFTNSTFTGVTQFFGRFANAGGGTSLPATTGTAQTGGILRLGRDNAILDIGSHSAGGAWIQSANRNNLATNYNLFLNPNGGNILIGTTTDAGFKLDVNGTARVSGIITAVGLVNPGSSVTLEQYVRSNTTQIFFQTNGAIDLISLSLTNTTFRAAQSISIGTGVNAVASAQLEVTSTTKGFLPPRMTTTQKNAIATPATGLMVYDTTLNLISVYNGTIWISL